MNYADLSGNERDALLSVVALNQDGEAPVKEIHAFFEQRFGPISRKALSNNCLSNLVDASLAHRKRSESDGRVRVYEPTEEAEEMVYQTLRERQRWIAEPEPRPDHSEQATLPEVTVEQ